MLKKIESPEWRNFFSRIMIMNMLYKNYFINLIA